MQQGSGITLTYAADDGETNNLTLSAAQDGYLLVDPGSDPLTVAGDCTLQPPIPPDLASHSAVCPSQGVTFISIDLGDGVDTLTIGEIATRRHRPASPRSRRWAEAEATTSTAGRGLRRSQEATASTRSPAEQEATCCRATTVRTTSREARARTPSSRAERGTTRCLAARATTSCAAGTR